MARQFRRGRCDGDSQSYLASVSDIMSGLIFIFIITLMVFALQLKDLQKDARKQLELYKEKTRQLEEEKQALLKEKATLLADKARLEALVRSLTDLKGIRRVLLAQIKLELETRGFKVEVDTEHGILRLPVEILFPSGSAKLMPEGSKMLSMLSEIIAGILPQFARKSENLSHGNKSLLEAIFVEGHTDNVPVGKSSKFEDNWDLSAARAINTYKLMLAHCPDLGGFLNGEGLPLFSVSGYADNRPVAQNDSVEGRDLNRRIDMRFIMSPPRETLEITKTIEEMSKYEPEGVTQETSRGN